MPADDLVSYTAEPEFDLVVLSRERWMKALRRGLVAAAFLMLVFPFDLPDWDATGAHAIIIVRAWLLTGLSIACIWVASLAWRVSILRRLKVWKRWSALSLGVLVGSIIALEATSQIWTYAQEDYRVGTIMIWVRPHVPLAGILTSTLVLVCTGIVRFIRRGQGRGPGIFLPVTAATTTLFTAAWLFIRADRIAYLTSTREVIREAPGAQVFAVIAILVLVALTKHQGR